MLQLTYSASLRGGRLRVALAIVICAVGVLARSTHVIGDELDGEVELSVGVGGSVGKQGNVALLTDGIPSNTEVDRSPIANGSATISPLAGLVLRSTHRVDVVLGRGRLTEPLVVEAVVWTSQLCRLARLGSDWNSFRLGTCVL